MANIWYLVAIMFGVHEDGKVDVYIFKEPKNAPGFYSTISCQNYVSANASGSGGSGGGTNAGTGGTGGTGGTYGNSGGTGATGANGNRTNGVGGSGGGASGKYIRGISFVTYTNNGSNLGGTA